MHPMFDLQAAKGCSHMFESLHLYKDSDGESWNMYLRFLDPELEHDDTDSGVLVKTRTIEPRRFKNIDTALKVAEELGFNALEVHTDGI